MTDEDMAAAGLPPDKKFKFEKMRQFKVWSQHWGAFKLYLSMRTQWRTTFAGVVGLDYTPIFHELDRMGLERSAYDDYFWCIQVLENAELNEIARKSSI